MIAGAGLEPTAAQMSFVNDICEELDIEEPEEFTRESYSEFISEYKDRLYSKRMKYGFPEERFIFWQ
jgi:hypothetical protein